MNKADKEALQRISRNGAYYVNGTGHDKRIDIDKLPVKRIRCNNNTCGCTDVVAIEKVYLWGSRRKGVVCRCHKCGFLSIVPVEKFETMKKSTYVYHERSYSEMQKRILELKGADKEDIEEISDIFKEEWDKKDRMEKIRKKSEHAKIMAEAQANQKKKEINLFKERLEKGEISYSKKQGVFFDVKTGEVVKRL